jgi:hypothetical protein
MLSVRFLAGQLGSSAALAAAVANDVSRCVARLQSVLRRAQRNAGVTAREHRASCAAV